MGAAWCRDRAEKAHDSKSPLDRVIVKCVAQMSLAERPISAPTVIQGPPKHPRLHLKAASGQTPEQPRPNSASEWQEVILKVPDLPRERSPGTAPVPPPRKKRTSVQNKVNQEKQEKKEVTKAEEEKPETPAIYLEVDTPQAQHRTKSSLLVTATKQQQQPKRSSDGDLLGLPARSKSSLSLRCASPVSEATAERVEQYMKSCRSFGSLKPEDLMDEIAQAFSDVSSDDSWAGVDDGEHFHPAGGSPPLTPTSQLAAKNSPTRTPTKPEFFLGDTNIKKKKRKSKKQRDAKKTDPDDTKTSNRDKGEVLQPSSTGINTHDDMLDVLAPPANFQTDPKSHIQHNKGSTSLIKPSQISVQDFMRQSNTNNKPPSGKFQGVLPELKLEVPNSEGSGFSFDFSKGLMPPRSPQIEIPGTPNTPRGLSRCSTPLPPLCTLDDTHTPSSSPTQEETLSSWTAAEDDTTSNLLRIMQEYHLTADVIGDRDAKKILEELGIPENLLDELPNIHKTHEINTGTEKDTIKIGGVAKKTDAPEENGSSGLSSMTPSLTELEASLSELLEASAVNNNDDDEDEFEEELRNQTPQVTSPPANKETTKATKKTETPHKDKLLLKAVIHQEVPKILPSQPEEISHAEDSSNKSKKDLDLEKPVTTTTTTQENRSNAITVLSNA